MCFKKVISFHKKYSKRCRSFYSSSISGLFTGVMIGILFNLLTNSQFDRWINPLSYEIFAAGIYVLLTFFVLWVFYIIGRGLFLFILFLFKITNKKEDLRGFKINFFAGMYSAAFSSSLIFLKENFKMSIYVAIAFILFYLPVEYYAVRNKSR